AAGATKGALAGAAAGDASGTAAGTAAGQTSGTIAGAAAGEAAGAAAGNTAGAAAGAASGHAAGALAGADAGAAAGQQAGTLAGAEAGANADADKPDPLALPFKVREKNYVWNIRQFGRTQREKQAGRDDNFATADIGNLWRRAGREGVAYRFDEGDYPIRSMDPDGDGISALYFNGVPRIDVDLTKRSRIYFGSELGNFTGSFLKFRASPDGSFLDDWTSYLKITGGLFDFRDLPEGPYYGVTAIDIFGFPSCHIDGIRVHGGRSDPLTGTGLGRLDTAVTTHNTNDIVVENSWFSGPNDTALYISGANQAGAPSGIGERCIVRKCTAEWAGKLVAAKRDFFGLEVSGCWVKYCYSGVIGSPAGTPVRNNEGRGWSITGNRFWFLNSRPIALYGGFGDTVTGNIIHDYGMSLAPHHNYTSPSSSNRIGGIGLYGTQHAKVTGNTVIQNLYWTPGAPPASGAYPAGIILGAQDREAAPVNARYNNVSDNVLRNVDRAIHEFSGGQDYNVFKDNDESGATNRSIINGPNSRMETARQNMEEVIPFPFPVLSSDGGDLPESAYLERDGFCSKRGSLLTFSFLIRVGDPSLISGALYVDLPVRAGAAVRETPFTILTNEFVRRTSANYQELTASMGKNGSRVVFYEKGASNSYGSRTRLTAAQLQPGALIEVSGSYQAGA
ncbi:hypothetical protein, partial [Roseomonas sp. USHLN139]|uniref:hypothetical protein n=1 Tax=Roseomonas sp. USHLN139 TaxID=3081298 RepID=UPI003B026F61